MSHKRLVWQEFSELAARMTEQGAAPADVSGLATEIGRLSKVQYRAAALAEAQAAQQAQALESLRQAVEALDGRQEAAVAAARHELLSALLPTLDGIEAALSSGARALDNVCPADRPLLSGWLDGLRLVRERLLAVLEKGGVTPIQAAGQAFDPYLHRAVAAVESETLVPGTVVREERRGYQAPGGVLRYADVVVSRKPGPPQAP